MPAYGGTLVTGKGGLGKAFMELDAAFNGIDLPEVDLRQPLPNLPKTSLNKLRWHYLDRTNLRDAL